jgi:hypothetical protein
LLNENEVYYVEAPSLVLFLEDETNVFNVDTHIHMKIKFDLF